MLESALRGYLNKRLIVCGDFNVRFNSNETTAILLNDLFSSFGFVQTIFNNTRLNNCIDNIFINFNIDGYETSIADPALSDHLGQTLKINCVKATIPPTKFKCRPITARGKISMYNMVSRLDWSFLDDTDIDFNKKFSIFHRNIIDAFNLAFPERDTNINKPRITWFNDNLRQMRNHLDLLNEMYRLHPTDCLKNNIKKI